MAEKGEQAQLRDPDQDDGGPGTQPADAQSGSASRMRPQATQAIFRPDFDDDDDLPHISVGSIDTEPQDQMTV
ncbi:MAG TPA: serine/threonine protein kinase, partial [Mycobacterium sp.]|nr:serine/threonine protein kinase [Mycobacterium sp.]